MRFRRSIVAACVLAATAAPAMADKAAESIDRAKAAYAQGDLGKAYTELQVAATRVARQLIDVYERTFPDPPAGWEVQKSRSRNRNSLVQGFILNRRYRQSGDGKGYITAQLIVDSPLLTAMAGIFNNPAMAMRQNYEQADVNGVGAPIWVKFDKDRGRGEAVLFLAGRVLIKMTGRNLEDQSALVNFLAAWDLATLKKTAGIN